MQPACVAHDFCARMQQEVIGVAKDELLAGIVSLSMVHKLESPVGPHGDEARCVNHAMGRVDATDSCVGAAGPVHHLVVKEVPRPPRFKFGGELPLSRSRRHRHPHPAPSLNLPLPSPLPLSHPTVHLPRRSPAPRPDPTIEPRRERRAATLEEKERILSTVYARARARAARSPQPRRGAIGGESGFRRFAFGDGDGDRSPSTATEPLPRDGGVYDWRMARPLVRCIWLGMQNAANKMIYDAISCNAESRLKKLIILSSQNWDKVN
eukprot:scaffold9827_cov32-Tisochrysis_lutea.AAC.1